MTAVTEVDPATSDPKSSRFSAFLELGKLRLSSLAIFSVVAGYYLGTPTNIPVDLRVVAIASIGSLLVAAGGNAFNMLMEREFDARMARTKTRPLPSGRLTPKEVGAFAWITSLLGLALLAMGTRPLAVVVCATILVSYTLIYTPLKRRTQLNTLIGAIPGALPPVVGYAAAQGRLDRGALALFLVLFFWQMPHFLAISWRLRKDYAAGGMKMLSVTDQTGNSLRRQMLIYTFALLFVSLLPYAVGLTGVVYLGVAFFLGLGFLVPVAWAAFTSSEAAMKWSFLASIIYLPLLYLTMVLDRPLVTYA